MRKGMPIKWTVAKARRRFADLMKSAVREPQPVYNRERVAAVVVGPDAYRELAKRPLRKSSATLAELFAEGREICRREGYVLETPKRRDRPNAFTASRHRASAGHQRPQ